ncbi:uncharacterized protein CLUP02_09258 [Colletotrichum lupini]|uniref:Uncharacterized protein n=1 Tax=Colletotrichum lupini TaxID=145971 RepID=A0A9Q8SW85_9PEZI|nr:uncharacterized protein CLUP02_09258 [Colletotrichum lupini]UQC83762.1 hypothetical protein CLUP02_09258 [Colletotrichum lupini]
MATLEGKRIGGAATLVSMPGIDIEQWSEKGSKIPRASSALHICQAISNLKFRAGVLCLHGEALDSLNHVVSDFSGGSPAQAILQKPEACVFDVFALLFMGGESLASSLRMAFVAIGPGVSGWFQVRLWTGGTDIDGGVLGRAPMYLDTCHIQMAINHYHA